LARIHPAKEAKLRQDLKRKVTAWAVNVFDLQSARISDHPTGIFLQFDLTFSDYTKFIDPKLVVVGASLHSYRPVGGTRTNPIYQYVLQFDIPELKEES
jgi:hypothetical protein